MLTNIGIQNFKCLDNKDIKLSSATLLLGTNSGGKSSLVQSLLLANEAARNIQLYKNPSLDLINNNYKLTLFSFDEILYYNSIEDVINISLTYDNKLKNTFSFTPTDDLNVISIQSENDPEIQEITYLSADRYITPYQRNGNINDIELGENNEFIGYIVDKGSKNHIKPYNERNHWNNSENKFLDIQINNWLEYILPTSKVTARTNKDDTFITLNFSNSRTLHQTNIGYGVSFILPIIVGGLIAKENSILIVENPELHLHPAAQSKIAEFLAVISASGVQVIIETHSEHIVNGFRKSILSQKNPLKYTDLCINYFDNTEKCTIEKIELNDRAEISYWPKGFMDQEENDLFELRRLRIQNG